METLAVPAGIVGVAVVLLAYGLLTSGKLAADSAAFQWLNIAGTMGILLSLYMQWNLPAFIANMAWLLVGIFTLVRHYRRRKASL